MIEFINLAMKGEWVVYVAKWIWNTIFLGWSSGLWNWHLACKEIPGFLNLDVVGSFILVVILLYLLWTAGLIVAYFGPWAWCLIGWAILWLFKFFLIPVVASLYFSNRNRLKTKNQKQLRSVAFLLYVILLFLVFDPAYAIWFLMMSIIYISVFPDEPEQ